MLILAIFIKYVSGLSLSLLFYCPQMEHRLSIFLFENVFVQHPCRFTLTYSAFGKFIALSFWLPYLYIIEFRFASDIWATFVWLAGCCTMYIVHCVLHRSLNCDGCTYELHMTDVCLCAMCMFLSMAALYHATLSNSSVMNCKW